MTIASRNQISHYHEAKSNLQSLVKQTCQVGLGFAVMLLVTAGRPSVFGLSVTVGLGIAFVTWGEVKRLDSSNFSINQEKQRENTKTYYDPIFQSQLYNQEEKNSKENSWNEELLDSLVQKIQISRKIGIRTEPDIKSPINQKVTVQGEQSKAFKLLTTADKVAVQKTVRAAYRQIFEQDLEPYIIETKFTELESKLSNNEINVKEFIEGLGVSDLYIKEFCEPFPNTEVIELGTKHFLGRAPINQKEIQKYRQILANQGISGFIKSMVNSLEYEQLFGEDTVPYRRFPTLPSAKFPNTNDSTISLPNKMVS
jgi:hypothetical protein